MAAALSGDLLAASGRERDPELVTLLRGIRDLIDGYLGRAVAEPQRDTAPSYPPPAPSNGRHRANGRSSGNGRSGDAGIGAPPAEAPAPVGTRPPGLAPSREELRRALLDEYVRRTGYPEEMLDPGLDLEAELGIDTVKQVAVLAAVRERFALAPDPAFKLRDANTLDRAIDWLAGRLGAKEGKAAATPRRAALEGPGPHAAPKPQRSTFEEPEARAAAPCPRTSSGDEARSKVLRMLVEEYARRTGYPEEMLAPDLDLEAELGIDTVKQVAVLAAVRERLGLPRDASFKLRDASTMTKAADALARRLVGEEPQDPRRHLEGDSTPARTASTTTGSAPLDAASGTGATTSSHEDGRFPSHGNDSVTTRLIASMLAAASGRVQEVIALSLSGVTDGSGDREPLVHLSPLDGSDGAVHLRALLGAASSEATVRVAASAEPDPLVEAPREILAAIESGRRTRPPSGDELRSTLAPIVRKGENLLEWARSDGFMVAVGGAKLPDADDARRSAAVLATAAELASFAWMGLTGAPHALAAVERARFLGLPAPGAEISLRAKMVPPEDGMWRADVLAISDDRVVAEIRGLTGTPISAAALPGSTGEAAERAWRRFCRRMRGDGTEGVA